MSNSYQSLLTNAETILEKYSLASFIKGFSPELINQLMRNHIDKVRECNDYDTGIKLVNAALTSQVGMSIQIASWITDPVDLKNLYDLFSAYRIKLLSGSI